MSGGTFDSLNLFHWLIAANQFSAACLCYFNFIAANVAFVLLSNFFYCHLAPPEAHSAESPRPGFLETCGDRNLLSKDIELYATNFASPIKIRPKIKAIKAMFALFASFCL